MWRLTHPGMRAIAAARVGEFEAALGVMGPQQRKRIRVVFAGHAEGCRHRVGGDVVMGGSDAARGEEHDRSCCGVH